MGQKETKEESTSVFFCQSKDERVKKNKKKKGFQLEKKDEHSTKDSLASEE